MGSTVIITRGVMTLDHYVHAFLRIGLSRSMIGLTKGVCILTFLVIFIFDDICLKEDVVVAFSAFA